MLHLTEPGRGWSRREFLSIGSLALGGLALPDLLQAQAALRAEGSPVKDCSVVFLFMHGGPPQTELFDPKMDAPDGVRSATGEIKTTLPGVTFGGTFPKLARLAHKFSVVRSFVTGDGNHDIKPIVGRETAGANLGSIYARVAGTTHPQSGLPRNVALYPQAVLPDTQPATMQFGKFGSTGELGSAYAPFEPSGGGSMKQDMEMALPRERLMDRRSLLNNLDQIRFAMEAPDALVGVDRYRTQAFDTILGGAAEAFDLSREDPRTLARYDTEPVIRIDRISQKWNNHKNYADHARSLGKLMLLARRLCERGCGFVTVTTNFVWDMHADVNNATVAEGMGYVGTPFDHAVSAFIQDVEQRGLSERILLVCCGEMGRTPRINPRGGRDHWGGLAPLMLHGGGLKMGQVVGQSNRDAGEPSSNPVTIGNLIATVMHVLLDAGQVRATAGVPRSVASAITGHAPIAELI